jgi:hypothetical protein
MTDILTLPLHFTVIQVLAGHVLWLMIAVIWYVIVIQDKQTKRLDRLLLFGAIMLPMAAYSITDNFFVVTAFFVPALVLLRLSPADRFADSEQGTPERTPPDTPPAHGREAKTNEGAF